MKAFLSNRFAVAVLTGSLALGVSALTPASAQMHGGHGGGHGGGFHGGGHGGGFHGGGYHGGYHRGYGGGYRHYGYGGGYYGGGYYGGGYYGTPCVPVIGLLSGNFCGY